MSHVHIAGTQRVGETTSVLAIFHVPVPPPGAPSPLPADWVSRVKDLDPTERTKLLAGEILEFGERVEVTGPVNTGTVTAAAKKAYKDARKRVQDQVTQTIALKDLHFDVED